MSIAALGLKLMRARMWRFLLFVCLIALLCVAAGGLGNHLLYGERAVGTVTLAIVDEDDTMESRLFFDAISGAVGDEELLVFHRTDAAEAQRMLESGEAGAVFTIPEGFTQSVLVGENDPFTITMDENAVLVTSLVQLFVDAYTDMLRAGQIGVFSALDIAYELEGDEGYGTMFRVANLSFISAMLNREQLLRTELVSATGQTSVSVYYGAVAYVFLNILGAVLFLDLLGKAASRPVLMRLRMAGRSDARCAGGYLAAACLPFLLVGAVSVVGLAAAAGVLGLDFASSMLLLSAVLMTAVCAGAFALAATLLFRHEAAGSVFVTAYSLLCLFLSGGVLPVAYFSAPLRAVSRCTPHYWLVRLLTEALAGQVAPEVWVGAGMFVLLFAALSVVGVVLRRRVGARP